MGVAELEVLRGTMEEELRVLAGQKDQVRSRLDVFCSIYVKLILS